jgi:hypothetical protein
MRNAPGFDPLPPLAAEPDRVTAPMMSNAGIFHALSHYNFMNFTSINQEPFDAIDQPIQNELDVGGRCHRHIVVWRVVASASAK